MNFKDLFIRLFTLIASPKKAWVEISTESPRRDVMGGFVYPLIALCGLAVLIGKLLYSGVERLTFHSAAIDICGYCVALFGGFFFAAWILDILRQKFFGHQSDMPGSLLFVGYAMGSIFVANILVELLPAAFILKWILQFYVLYVVWEGSEVLFGISEEKRLTFTIITTVAVVFSPEIINLLFNALSKTLG